jgi:hypothetical protein
MFSNVQQTSAQTTPIVIEIQVSPNVLNLQNKGQVVTVHTNIAYSTVASQSVSLNGVEIDHWKSDNRGYFVAKFLMEEILALELEIGEYNELTLDGITTNGDTFTGTDLVLVVNNIPAGKN